MGNQRTRLPYEVGITSSAEKDSGVSINVPSVTQPRGNVLQMTGNMDQRSGEIFELQVVNEESIPKEAMDAKAGSVRPWRESRVKQADNLVQSSEEDKTVKEWARE